MINDTAQVTDEQVRAALVGVRPAGPNPNRSVRICMEWLAAQTPKVSAASQELPLKHVIEKWAGSYVSTTHVKVAAELLHIPGDYPLYHLQSNWVWPDIARLAPYGSDNYYEPSYIAFAGGRLKYRPYRLVETDLSITGTHEVAQSIHEQILRRKILDF